MAFVKRKTLFTLTALSAVAVLGAGGFIWSGFYNVAADDPHTGPVYAVLETMRNRSIETRAGKLQMPENLLDPARVTQGAGNYNAMCMGCHLAPGMADTELSRGLYPAPPNLSRVKADSAEAFWVIKHGIKASGMPAWGESMDDQYIWNMAAFLQELPGLSPEQYEAMVASSGGHDHGGGETRPHGHADGVPEDHDRTPSGDAAATAPAAHAHPAGTPAHDDAPADAQAGKDISDANAASEAAAHAHPPGTPADHHAKESVAAPKAPATPAPDATEQAEDSPDHQH